MNKIGIIVLLSALTFSAFGQQFLWSTMKKDGEKQVPINRVTEEVLKFYDYYKLYYDYSGFSKERFIEEIAVGFDDMEDLNDITELTVYAGKSNTGYGSFVSIACISEDNVDMIVFSNTPIEGDFSFQRTGSYDRERFVGWFKTLIHETGYDEDDKGTVESRALYGKSGGPSLDLGGWMRDFTPRPDDTSDENGRIVFEIKVDARGEVVAVKTLAKTVSPAVELIYRREVERLTFSPTYQKSHPPSTTGMITFIIRSK